MQSICPLYISTLVHFPFSVGLLSKFTPEQPGLDGDITADWHIINDGASKSTDLSNDFIQQYSSVL